ncbi:MAG: SAM-dependent MidA family methyltransferase [Gammaproteobacteria bacterium]|jgi:SAM-dependent MidA family methyltransferase
MSGGGDSAEPARTGHETPAWAEPLEHERERSAALRELLVTRMAQRGGSLPFCDYMHAVLNEPGLGYYASGVSGFGAQGDFVTAPELSPIFAHCLANAIGPVLRQLGAHAHVLEVGAGSGALAIGLLEALNARGELPARYYIVEPSAHLQAVQRERLSEIENRFGVPIQWVQTLDLDPFDGVVLANEVLDTLPVELFQMSAGLPYPVHVGADGDVFFAQLGPHDHALTQWCNTLQRRLGWEFADDYRSERSGWVHGWLNSAQASLRRGSVVLIDYGYEEREYYHWERAQGTLMSYYRHRAHADPFFLPGLQDLTASVDFSAVASAAQALGLDIAGYTTQAWFLIGNEMAQMLEEFVGTEREYAQLAGAVRTLTLPGEMGERIKVIALNKDMDFELRGFADRDLRGRL